MQWVARDVRVRKREEVLARRFAKGMQKPEEYDDPDAYQFAWLALSAERDGELKRAADLWDALRKKYPDADALREPLADARRTAAMWAWVAAKRVGDIKAADDKAAQIPAALRQNRANEYWPAFAPADPEGMAVFAFRLELFRDDAKAREMGPARRADGEEPRPARLASAGDRPPALARRGEGGRGAAEAGRAGGAGVGRGPPGRGRRPLGAAPPAVKLREARNHCRDVIDLYDGDPADTLRAAVAEAKQVRDAIR